MGRGTLNEKFFFDTYAFFELIQGNPAYERYRTAQPITTIVNLAELSFGIRREHPLEESEKYVKKYSQMLTDIEIHDVIKATEFKINNRHLSLVDAIGYCVAQRLEVKFLTGDKEFKHMKNVEFVR